MKTDQLNIRISKELLDDLDIIARHERVTRNEWVRYNIAQYIKTAKEKIIENLEFGYVNGRKTAKEYADITGYHPSKELILERVSRHEANIALVKKIKHRKFARQALLENLLKKNSKRITHPYQDFAKKALLNNLLKK